MATNPSTLAENVGRITAPDANYPHGSAKDDTTGTAGDGTPIKKALMNDSYGFFQAALAAAGIEPSGNAETAVASQILQALQGVVGSFSDKSQWPTVANGVDTAHDIVFSAGKIPDSNGLLPIATAGITKQIDAAWAVGTNAGGLFSGSVAADTTYHLFLIVKASDGSVDAGFDTDAAAANIPAGYAAFRRIASLTTDASGSWVQFYQQGDYFGLKKRVRTLYDFTGPLPLTATAIYMNVPTGLSNMKANWHAYLSGSDNLSVAVGATYDTFSAIQTPEYDLTVAQFGTATQDQYSRAVLTTPADSSGSINYMASSPADFTLLAFTTDGWTDDRTE